MYYNVFKRNEKKYLLSFKQKELLLKEIRNYLKEDEYFKSTICNIYFDTPNNDLIINSIDKPLYKTKIRLRSYKVPNLEDEVFLEIKSKYNGIVQKRRIKMSLKEFYNYQDKGIINKDEQIMRELDYYFRFYNLKPFIFIGYDRVSYRGIDDDTLRLTFDCNIRSREDNLRLEYGDKGEKYFDDDYYVMEIKTLDCMPLWLANSLSKHKIYPVSFSKVGRIYEKNIRREDKYND